MQKLMLIAIATFSSYPFCVPSVGLAVSPPQFMVSFEVSDRVPNSNVLSKAPYRTRGQWVTRDNLDSQIIGRETKYSWFWFQKAVNPALLRGAKREALRFFSDLGEHGDDAAVLTWATNGYTFELVDSRVLTLLVQKDELANVDILELFESTVNFRHHCNRAKIDALPGKPHDLDTTESWGTVVVNRGTATGWFEHPVRWYRNGDFVLFLFDKQLRPPASRIPVRDASTIVGGIPVNDSRKWLRFEEMNRDKLARDYYDKEVAGKAGRPTPDPHSTKSVPLK